MPKFKTLLFLTLIFTSCNQEIEPVKHNYLEIKDSLIPWSDVFIQEENSYYVYFYSELCGHCSDIKQDVISFYLKEEYVLYFVCTDYEKVIGPKKDLTGINNTDDFYIFGTPFMVLIEDHIVSEYYAGSGEILELISILENYYS